MVLLIVDPVHGGAAEQSFVLEGVGHKGVEVWIPQTAAADLHPLTVELADVDQDDGFIPGDHELLHAGPYHLQQGQKESVLNSADVLMESIKRRLCFHLLHRESGSFLESDVDHTAHLGGDC